MKRLLRVLGWILGVLVRGLARRLRVPVGRRHPRVDVHRRGARPARGAAPEGFLWGTATASHQVEGGNTNDWTRFEAQPGAIERGETSAVAADHWNRMAEDVALMKAIRANAYRFSIEWSRLEPQEGAWNEEAWARYGDLVRQLREAGITPAVTLLHFTLPLWMADRGGVDGARLPRALLSVRGGGRASGSVPASTSGSPSTSRTCRCTWATSLGGWPPQKKSPPEAVRAFAGLLRGHAAAVGGPAGGRPRGEDRRREQRDAARAEVAADAGRLARRRCSSTSSGTGRSPTRSGTAARGSACPGRRSTSASRASPGPSTSSASTTTSATSCASPRARRRCSR